MKSLSDSPDDIAAENRNSKLLTLLAFARLATISNAKVYSKPILLAKRNTYSKKTETLYGCVAAP